MNRGLVIIALLAATPAWAQAAGTPVPEPSDIALFALGVAGLLIGRRSSRRSMTRPDDDA